MSTNYQLTCTAHTPPIESDVCIQNTALLPLLRRIITNRHTLITAMQILEWPDLGYRNGGEAIRFLNDHPNCPIVITDEYGRSHPTEEGTSD